MLKIRKSHPTFQKIQLGSLVALVGACIFAIPFVSAKPNQLSDYNRERFAQNDIVFYDPGGTASETPPGQSDPCVSGGSGSGVAFSGSTAEEKLWNGLTSFLTDEQAAGVMGNMWNESHLNPAAHGRNRGYFAGFDYINDDGKNHNPEVDYGIGITQWSGGRRTNFLQCWILNIEACNNKYSRPEDYADLIDIYNNYSRYGSHTIGIQTIFDRAAEDGISDKMDRLLAANLEYLRREINKTYTGLLNQTTVAGATDWFRIHYEVNDGGDNGRRDRAQGYYDKYHGTGGGNNDDDECHGGDSYTITSSETGEKIAEVAAKFSWPVQAGQGDDEHIGMCLNTDNKWVTWEGIDESGNPNKDGCKNNPRPSYKTEWDKEIKNYDIRGCDSFLAAVLYYLDLDEGKMPKSGAGKITNFLSSSSNWIELENKGKNMNLLPGDIFANTGHVSIYLGSYAGSYGSNAAGSYLDWVGRITKYTTHSDAIQDGKWANLNSTHDVFRIFRYNAGTTGGEDGKPPSGDDENPPSSGDDENPPSGGDDGNPPSSGDDENPPSGGDDENPPSSGGSGCISNNSGTNIGCTDASSFFSQFGNNTRWKGGGCGTGANGCNNLIKASGCPIVAVANAQYALNSNSNTLNDLISTIKNTYLGGSYSDSSSGCGTGGLFSWNSSEKTCDNNGKVIIEKLGNVVGSTESATSTFIDNALKGGHPVILGGNRTFTGDCTNSSNTSAGKCLFTKGGHFITIIGKKGDSYIVANPANGSRREYTWSLITANANKLKAYSMGL